MDQLSISAYESMGCWHLGADYVQVTDDGQSRRETIYRGDHVAIDDEDPLVRAMLLLHQMHTDLEVAIRDNVDMLAPRPMSH